jgi:putative membrane protein
MSERKLKKMPKFLTRLIVNAGALYLAVLILSPHIVMQNEKWWAFLVLALIFGLVNALIRPLLMIASCPLIVLSLGLGTLVVNTVMFLLAGWIGSQVEMGFIIPENQFWFAFLGALIVSIVSFILSRILGVEKK